MMSNRKGWKRRARAALSERLGICIAAALLVTVSQLAGNYLVGMLFPGVGRLSIVLGEVFAFALTLILCILSAGMYRMYLNVARCEEASLGDLVYFFKNQPDRVIVASFVMALIAWITSLPASIYNYMNSAVGFDNYDQLLSYMSTYSMLMLLGLVLNIIFTIPFTLTYYLLSDNEDLSGTDALRESMHLMKGHMGEYLLLELSFIPWAFLLMISFFLAALWVVPYMEMSSIMFYRDLTGELNIQKEGEIHEYH